MAVEKLNKYQLPGNRQIPAKLMQAGGENVTF
jgi:hypothetical protein